MVDKNLILRKFDRINGHLAQLRKKKDPGSAAFAEDPDLQSIVLFNLIQAIQSCIDIGTHIIGDMGWEAPSSQADVFNVLAAQKVITRPLAKKLVQMAGFRNRIVHEYEKVDMKIVHEVWRRHVKDIEAFCKAVAERFGV